MTGEIKTRIVEVSAALDAASLGTLERIMASFMEGEAARVAALPWRKRLRYRFRRWVLAHV